MWWISVVIVVIIAWVAIRVVLNRDDFEKRKEGLTRKLYKQKNFQANVRLELDNYRVCLAIDEKRNKFCIINNTSQFGYKSKDYIARTFNYKDLLKVKFIENGISFDVDKAINSYQKIATESVLLSENGLSLADLYDEEQGYDSIQELGIQLIVNKVNDPVIFISMLADENGCEKGSQEYKEALDKAKEFYERLNSILEIRDKNFKDNS